MNGQDDAEYVNRMLEEANEVINVGFEDLLRDWDLATRVRYWQTIFERKGELGKFWAKNSGKWSPAKGMMLKMEKDKAPYALLRLSATFHINGEANRVDGKMLRHDNKVYELLHAVEREFKYINDSADDVKRMIDAKQFDGVAKHIDRFIIDFQKMAVELLEIVTGDEKPGLKGKLDCARQKFNEMFLMYIKTEHAFKVFGELKEIYGRYSAAEKVRAEIEERVSQKDLEIESMRCGMQALRDEKARALASAADERGRAREVADSYREREAALHEQWQKTIESLNGFKTQYEGAQSGMMQGMERFNADNGRILESLAERMQSQNEAFEKRLWMMNDELVRAKVENAELNIHLKSAGLTLKEREEEVRRMSGELEKERTDRKRLEGTLSEEVARAKTLSEAYERTSASAATDRAERERIGTELEAANGAVEAARAKLQKQDALLQEKEREFHILREGLETGEVVTASQAKAIESSIISRFLLNLQQHRDVTRKSPIAGDKEYKLGPAMSSQDSWAEGSEAARLYTELGLTRRQAEALPANRSVALLLSRMFSGAGIRLETLVYGHVMNYGRPDLRRDDQKMAKEETVVLADRAAMLARVEKYYSVLCIASPTGFGSDTLAWHASYRDPNLCLVLYDAQSGKMHAHERRFEQFRELFDFREARDDKTRRLAEQVRTLMLLTCEGMVSEGYCAYETRVAREKVREAFESLERDGAADIIRKMDGIEGWVLKREGGS